MIEFEQFIAIDWSGAKTQYNRALAVAAASPGRKAPQLIKPYGKKWSRTDIASLISSLTNYNTKRLIGIDCNFGFSRPVFKKHFAKCMSAPALWDVIDTSCDAPDYYAEGFWSHETYRDLYWHGDRPRPEDFLTGMHERETERRCRVQNFGKPSSPFHLIGASQVGKGGLAGMRMLLDLKRRHPDRIAIWPFDRDVSRFRIVIVEIYPTMYGSLGGARRGRARADGIDNVLSALQSDPIDRGPELNGDAYDALIGAAGLRHLCASQTMDELFHPDVDTNLLECEGWIFGT